MLKNRNLPRLLSLRKRLSPKWLTLLFLVLLTAGDIWVLRHHLAKASPAGDSLRIYTQKDLSRFDGSDPSLPVLLGFDGFVYDVSAGREKFYGPGKPYHMLAGTDASTLLHIAGGEIIVRKYHVVGRITP